MCSDGLTVQSMEEIPFLVGGFTHCPCSSQWPWVVFLHKHPRPYSLQFRQPVAILFKGQYQLSRNCSTNPKASCAFAVHVLLWSSLVRFV